MHQVLLAAVPVFFPAANAQGNQPGAATQIADNVAKGFSGVFVLSHATKVWLLIGVRFALVGMLAIAAMVAVMSAYNWTHNEGNDVKKDESKKLLGNAVFTMTLFFVLLAVLHYFVPDYSLLSL